MCVGHVCHYVTIIHHDYIGIFLSHYCCYFKCVHFMLPICMGQYKVTYVSLPTFKAIFSNSPPIRPSDFFYLISFSNASVTPWTTKIMILLLYIFLILDFKQSVIHLMLYQSVHVLLMIIICIKVIKYLSMNQREPQFISDPKRNPVSVILHLSLDLNKTVP